MVKFALYVTNFPAANIFINGQMEVSHSSPSSWPRAVLHLDADAFFASVEELLNPQLKEFPLIVGGPRDSRSVVSSANYKARAYGVRSAMSIKKALELCPHAKLVCSGFDHYRHFSKLIFEVCSRYSSKIEPSSIDEAYLELSLSGRDQNYRQLALEILSEIYRKTGLYVSGGLSINKTISKISSSLNKPRKLTTIYPGLEQKFLHPLPIQSLPGVGPSTMAQMHAQQIFTIGHLAAQTREAAFSLFGNWGLNLWLKANALDQSELCTERPSPKSISNETTFYRDQADQQQLISALEKLSQKAKQRLQKKQLFTSQIKIKIRYADFKTFSYSKCLNSATDSFEEINGLAQAIFSAKWQRQPIRLLGIGLGKLTTTRNLSIFDYLA